MSKGTSRRDRSGNGVYKDLLDAVGAMEVGDLLRWDLPRGKFHSAVTRITSDSIVKTWRTWRNGQIWIVRYE